MRIHPEPVGALLHPLHAILLAFPIALFSAGLASDIAYLNTSVIQWSNVSAWLIAGAELFGGLVLIWAIVCFLTARSRPYRGRALAYLIVVAVMWLAGLLNAFNHSQDAWSSVGTLGLLLSIVTTILALVAGWIGYAATPVREVGQ